MLDFKLELVTARERRAIALGAVALIVLAASAIAWLWPQASRAYSLPPAGPVQVLAAEFRSANTGWVALRSGVGPQAPSGIYRTEDGGRTWQVLPVPVRTPIAATLRFFGPQDGLVEMIRDESDGRTSLFQTVDGGGSWQARRLPRFQSGQATIYFADNVHGFEVFRPSGSTFDDVYRTSDGGRSWTSAAMTGLPPPPVFGLGFIDERRGFAVAGNAIYRSLDAGESWQPAPTPVGFVFTDVEPPLAFGDTVILPFTHALFISHDGGAHFTDLRRTPLQSPSTLACLDALHCRGTQGTTYLATEDGGSVWSVHDAHVALDALRPVDPKTTWAVTSTRYGQKLLVTRNAGASWSAVTLPRI